MNASHKNTRNLSVLSLMFALTASHCAKPRAGDQEEAKLKSIETQTFPGQGSQLGLGYRRDQGRALFTECIEGEQASISLTSEAQVFVGQNLETEEYLDSIGGSLGGGASTLGFRAGGSLKVLEFYQSQETRSSFQLFLRINKMARNFAVHSLRFSATAEEILRNHPEDFVAICGDSYVSQINYGALFYGQLVFDFASKKQKHEIEGSLKASLGGGGFSIASLSGFTHDANEQALEQVMVSVAAYQFGGRPEQLAQILTDSVVQCSLADLAPCIETFTKLTNYANDNLGGQFEDDQSLSPVRVASFSYEDVPAWQDIGFPLDREEDSKSKGDIQKLQTHLQELFIALLSDRHRIEHILSYFDATLSEGQRRGLQENLLVIKANELAISRAGDVCYRDTADECYKGVRRALGEQAEYGRGLMEDLALK